jgi:hypothetical protein
MQHAHDHAAYTKVLNLEFMKTQLFCRDVNSTEMRAADAKAIEISGFIAFLCIDSRSDLEKICAYGHT